MCWLPDQPPNPARLDLQRGAESSAPNPAAHVHNGPPLPRTQIYIIVGEPDYAAAGRCSPQPGLNDEVQRGMTTEPEYTARKWQGGD